MSHKGVDGRGRYGNEVGNSLRNKRERERERERERRTDGGGRGCKPKGAYKEVPRPSRRLGFATTKSSLTLIYQYTKPFTIGRNYIFKDRSPYL